MVVLVLHYQLVSALLYDKRGVIEKLTYNFLAEEMRNEGKVCRGKQNRDGGSTETCTQEYSWERRVYINKQTIREKTNS